ncbi:hypothetical protein Tco_0495662 [Tanacetum coccineum]
MRQRNFQNMMLNMFQKQMGNSNASGSGTLPSNTITNLRCEARAIRLEEDFYYVTPGSAFLRTARVLIDVHGEELVIRDGMERIVFKPDGSQDKESIHMMDIYDDRFKDVCEPESNDSSSPTSTIVEEFESLVEENYSIQKEKLRKYLTQLLEEGFVLASNLENFRIIHQGRVIQSPQIAFVDMDLNDEFSDEEGDVTYLEKLLEVLNDDPFSPITPLEFKKEDKNVESLE